jgi:hypothetical protein
MEESVIEEGRLRGRRGSTKNSLAEPSDVASFGAPANQNSQSSTKWPMVSLVDLEPAGRSTGLKNQ